jgi:hypothetical protein
MRRDNLTSLWGDNKLILIEHVADRKIERATNLVLECSNNERGFCYSEVKKYPLDTGKELRYAIKYLKAERINSATTDQRASVISDKLKVLKHLERGHYLYDRSAYEHLRATYDKLHTALALLQAEGDINSFTLRPNGYLKINWFTLYHFEDIVVIEQGWTFKEREVWLSAKQKRALIKADKAMVGARSENDMTEGQMNSSGYIVPQNYHPPVSHSGAGDMNVTTDHYKHNITHAPHRGGVAWATVVAGMYSALRDMNSCNGGIDTWI